MKSTFHAPDGSHRSHSEHPWQGWRQSRWLEWYSPPAWLLEGCLKAQVAACPSRCTSGQECSQSVSLPPPASLSPNWPADHMMMTSPTLACREEGDHSLISNGMAGLGWGWCHSFSHTLARCAREPGRLGRFPWKGMIGASDVGAKTKHCTHTHAHTPRTHRRILEALPVPRARDVT